MGYDLVIWSPRVGANGDDVYNFPGAHKLDGTIDGGAGGILRGGSSAFSATPTIAEINASSDWNQICGLINRRVLRYNTLFGTSVPTIAYKSGSRFLAADVIGLRQKINYIRTQEGFQNYVWATQNGPKMRLDVLAECRKALRISGVATINSNSSGMPGGDWYVREDRPTYGTFYSESFSALSLIFYTIGKQPGSSQILRYRLLQSFNIPDWCTSNPAAATFIGTVANTDSGQNLEAFNINLYSSNSDDFPALINPQQGGSAYNAANLEGSVSNTLGGFSIAVDTNRVIARAGAHLSTILASSVEINGSGIHTYGSCGISPTRQLALDCGA